MHIHWIPLIELKRQNFVSTCTQFILCARQKATNPSKISGLIWFFFFLHDPIIKDIILCGFT